MLDNALLLLYLIFFLASVLVIVVSFRKMKKYPELRKPYSAILLFVLITAPLGRLVFVWFLLIYGLNIAVLAGVIGFSFLGSSNRWALWRKHAIQTFCALLLILLLWTTVAASPLVGGPIWERIAYWDDVRFGMPSVDVRKNLDINFDLGHDSAGHDYKRLPHHKVHIWYDQNDRVERIKWEID
ncbi:MAG: hypothetical protein ABIH23_12805 [bacterium]